MTKLSTIKAQKAAEQVTFASPPQILAVNVNGDRYVKANDLVAWFLYIADHLVDKDEPDPAVREGEALLADQIRLLATFTTERLAV